MASEEAALSTTGSRPVSTALASFASRCIDSTAKKAVSEAGSTFAKEYTLDLFLKGRGILPSLSLGTTISKEGSKTVRRSGVQFSQDLTEGWGLCHVKGNIGKVDSWQGGGSGGGKANLLHHEASYEAESIRGINADLHVLGTPLVNLDTGKSERTSVEHKGNMWGSETETNSTKALKFLGLTLSETTISTTHKSYFFHSLGTTTTCRNGHELHTKHHVGILGCWFVDIDGSGHIGLGQDAHLAQFPMIFAAESFLTDVTSGVDMHEALQHGGVSLTSNLVMTCALTKGVPFLPIHMSFESGQLILSNGILVGYGETARQMLTLNGEEVLQELNGLQLGAFIPGDPIGIVQGQLNCGHVVTKTMGHLVALDGLEVDLLGFDRLVPLLRLGIIHEEVSTYDAATDTDLERCSDGWSFGLVEVSQVTESSSTRSQEHSEEFHGSSFTVHLGPLYGWQKSWGHFSEMSLSLAGRDGAAKWMETFDGEKEEDRHWWLFGLLSSEQMHKTGQVHRFEHHHSNFIDGFGIVTSRDTFVETGFGRTVVDAKVTEARIELAAVVDFFSSRRAGRNPRFLELVRS